MATLEQDRRLISRIIDQNRQQYGDRYHTLKWLTEAEAEAAAATRASMLSGLKACTRLGYHGTKLDCTDLSPGCQSCGSGTWSCLFINGRCNCRCFYCPTEQNQVGLPTTHRIQFQRPADYVDYIDRFGYRGVSISGGEPLLTFDTTLKYIAAVKKRFADRVYLWLYTNGTLSTPSILSRLRDVGLDEIRFDIGATGYHLDKARQAVGVIPHVTVEIPAVPDDITLLKEKLNEMADAGITHLNLHQLRLTPYNFENLKNRNYIYLHGDKVTVLDSEFTALRLLIHAHEHRIRLPINYCSFVYKHRYQNAAMRRKSTEFIREPYEDITESGYIRSLYLTGLPEALMLQADRFEKTGLSSSLWQINRKKDRLYFSLLLWKDLIMPDMAIYAVYCEPHLMPAVTYRNPFKEIFLNKRKKVVVEKTRVGEVILLNPGERSFFDTVSAAAGEKGAPYPPAHDRENRVIKFETIPYGFQAYF